MKTIYLFDVDGTLTPATKAMETGFAAFFLAFAHEHPVYLISGSDMPKIIRQVPDEVRSACLGIFACSGAEFYSGGKAVFRREHVFADDLVRECELFVDQSVYPVRTGSHLEFRTGSLNVSTVGRMADRQQRKEYFEWDSTAHERLEFASRINTSGLPYEASVGGEISVDIMPSGWNKSSAKDEILRSHPDSALVFFGNRMEEGGNDRPLALALDDGSGLHKSFSVRDYRDTWNELQNVSGNPSRR